MPHKPGATRHIDLTSFDSNDRRLLYLAWHAYVGYDGNLLIPEAERAFQATRKYLGRETLVFLLSGYARFFPQAVGVVTLALNDKSQAVRRRAEILRAYAEGETLPGESSGFWFLFSNQKGRQPRGRFADTFVREHSTWLGKRGLKPVYAFAHEARFESPNGELQIVWDSYDGLAHIYPRFGEKPGKAIPVPYENRFHEHLSACLKL